MVQTVDVGAAEEAVQVKEKEIEGTEARLRDLRAEREQLAISGASTDEVRTAISAEEASRDDLLTQRGHLATEAESVRAADRLRRTFAEMVGVYAADLEYLRRRRRVAVAEAHLYAERAHLAALNYGSGGEADDRAKHLRAALRAFLGRAPGPGEDSLVLRDEPVSMAPLGGQFDGGGSTVVEIDQTIARLERAFDDAEEKAR